MGKRGMAWTENQFHPAQQRAIETIICCHEILQAKSIGELFHHIAPEYVHSSKPVYDEVMNIPFPKYCFKMATGTGKTYILAAILVWQYFNSINNEKPQGAAGESKDWYPYRFLVVAPGREVLNRLLDSFKGRKTPILVTGIHKPHIMKIRSSCLLIGSQSSIRDDKKEVWFSSPKVR